MAAFTGFFFRPSLFFVSPSPSFFIILSFFFVWLLDADAGVEAGDDASARRRGVAQVNRNKKKKKKKKNRKYPSSPLPGFSINVFYDQRRSTKTKKKQKQKRNRKENDPSVQTIRMPKFVRVLV